jgi:hypothetical protein
MQTPLLVPLALLVACASAPARPAPEPAPPAPVELSLSLSVGRDMSRPARAIIVTGWHLVPITVQASRAGALVEGVTVLWAHDGSGILTPAQPGCRTGADGTCTVRVITARPGVGVLTVSAEGARATLSVTVEPPTPAHKAASND